MIKVKCLKNEGLSLKAQGLDVEEAGFYEKYMKLISPEVYGEKFFDSKVGKWFAIEPVYEPEEPEEPECAVQEPETKRVSTYKRTWGLTTKQHKALREAILDRDKWKCRDCGAEDLLHIHHIVERACGGSNEEGNLVTLCADCHAKRHKGNKVYNLMHKYSMFKLQQKMPSTHHAKTNME